MAADAVPVPVVLSPLLSSSVRTSRYERHPLGHNDSSWGVTILTTITPKWVFTVGPAMALVILAGMFGCHSKTAPSAQANPPINAELLRRGIGGEPASLDPGQAGDTFSFEVIRDLYEGLATESPEGEVEPGVAVSWSINPTSTKYTFQLRHNARWSNGKNVRAQDFVFAWRRVVDPKRASPVADFLRPIAHAAEIISGRLSPTLLGVYAVQDDILVVQLEQPAPYFLQLLTHTATFPIYSEESASAHTPQNWVSNGPYVLSNWTPGASITLTKNPQYWDRSSIQIKQIAYFPIADENSELRQYRAGQLDVTQTVPSSALPLVRKEFPKDLLVAPYLGTVYCAINLRLTRYSSSVKLRQALAMAIDRRVLENTILTFGQSPAYGFVPPGTWNYDQQSWQWKSMPDAERVTEARRLYSAAGYSSNNPLHVRFLFNESPAIRKLAIAIASMWKDSLGIETELIDEEYRVFLDSRKDRSRWDVARLGWTADYNDAGNFLDIFRRGSPNNDAGYANTNFDSLLDAAAATSDSLYRKSVLEEAERLVLSEYPIIPIYFYSSKRLIKPYIKGARTNPLNKLYSKHLVIVPN
jgi:oligopeptide transport system substrate-binding protein